MGVSISPINPVGQVALCIVFSLIKTEDESLEFSDRIFWKKISFQFWLIEFQVYSAESGS